MPKKIIIYFLCAVLAAFLIWQGIFWTGECIKICKYSSVMKKAGMQVSSFWESIDYSSRKMPFVGVLLRYYDYQDYVAREEFYKRVPIDWEEWNNDWITKRPQMDEAMEQLYQDLKARAKAEKADIYGGETPEETWTLFIDALKKEDFELASKYFVADKQADYLDMFNTVKEKGQYEIMTKELETASTIWQSEETVMTKSGEYAQYWYNFEEETVSREILFKKNLNKKWKIDSI